MKRPLLSPPGSAALCATALLVCACSGPENPPQSALRIPARILPESFALGGSAETAWLQAAEDGGYTLHLSGARKLRALYIEAVLPAGASLACSEFTGLLDPEAQTISLALSPQPGRLVLGQLIARPQEHPGFSGSGVLARLRMSSGKVCPRRACSPPRSPAAQSPLGLDLGSGELRWRYYNPGDYDQNREVGIADLTPLGLHFGAGGGPFDPATALSVIDGDGNGEINLADLTPIGQNFGARLTGYKLYLGAGAEDVPADGMAPSTISPFATVNNGSGAPATDRLAFSFTLASIQPGGFYWVRPYEQQGDSYVEGTPSSVVDVGAIEENLPPQAQLSAPGSSVTPGTPVLLEAGGSSDPDGSIAEYLWDPENDGVFTAGPNGPASSWLLWYPSQPGTFTLSVRVVDNLGAEDTASLQFEVSFGTAHFDTIDPDTGGLNFPPSLKLIHTLPAVAYVADGDDTVRYSRATSDSLGTWTAPYELGTAFSQICDLELVASKPALAWSANEGLAYCRAQDDSGSSWEAVQIVTPNPQGYFTGIAPDLALVGGNPAILYSDSSQFLAGNTLFRRANDALGTAWGGELVVNQAGESGYAACLKVLEQPAALYINDVSSNNLHLALATDAQASAFGSPLIISSAGKIDANLNSLQILPGGHLIVIFYQQASGQLMLSRATDLSGTDWAEPELICDAPGVGNGFSCATLVSLPAVAFHLAGEGLALCLARDPLGEAWNEPLLLALGASNGLTPALISHLGLPVLVYEDGSSTELVCLHFD